MRHRLVAIVITMYLLRIPIQQHRTEIQSIETTRPADSNLSFGIERMQQRERPMTHIRAHLGGSDRSENQMLHTVKYFKSRLADSTQLS